jgi:predicted Rossmann fold nucleotide-binding protein DprA/Smf involved in DNA uptake
MAELLENTYWIAIAHLPRWQTERINNLVVQVIHEHKLSWADFFALEKQQQLKIFAFNEKELTDIEGAKNDLPRLSFVAEQLQNEGFQVIPINSPDYPGVLKENLKTKSSPTVLYIKGRKGLLQENAVAIVGSRNAGEVAIKFTDMIARKCASEQKVIVSGFAKGVDKQALDSALAANGKSIIVLPQGILTFRSGLKQYYEQIVNGKVLVLSTFFPQAGWDVGLAMARNVYIYGLANEIYVAESDAKGGTWEGAIEGLKRRRSIYVRLPEAKEKNANLKLVEFGALPVGMSGEVEQARVKPDNTLFQSSRLLVANEPTGNYNTESRDIEKEILELLGKGAYTSQEILLALKLDWESRKITAFLNKNPNVKVISGKHKSYTLTASITPSLFDEP